MRKLSIIVTLGWLVALLATAFANAQTVQLPSATPSSVTVPWTLPSSDPTTSCTSTQQCIMSVYRQTGTCPSVLVGSTGWTLVGTSSANATQYIDNTTSPNTTYAYTVEASPVGATTTFSGPANCQSIKTPFHPAPVNVSPLSAN